MAKKMSIAVDPRLAKLITICESLPGATHEAWFDHHVFRIGKKTIAYFLNNHHGDGIISVCCKSTKPRQAELVAEAPKKFYLPAYMAHQGWVGLRLDGKTVDWEEVASLMVAAYRLQATKRLLAMLEDVE
jgi:predicted DNA-binding protein (MmcQ/YjbR family)